MIGGPELGKAMTADKRVPLISATGSTYADALNALLVIATASTTYDAAQGPVKN